MKNTLNSHNNSTCLIDLSIGGVNLTGQVVALREYLRHGRKPKLIVLGISIDNLLSDDMHVDESSFVGSRAIILLWSHLKDVYIHYPNFPKEGRINGIKFLIMRTNALTTFGSIIWLKIQRFQNYITGKSTGETNRFGAVEDMKLLANDFFIQLQRLISTQKLGHDTWSEHRWYSLLKQLLVERDIPLALVEVPIFPPYASQIEAISQSSAIKDWIARRLPKCRLAEPKCIESTLINLNSVPGINAAFFPDKIHLSTDGAKIFSKHLGEKLSLILQK
ncbi:MAG: hypothetical protein AABZ06_07340 [Bdellovibrionota bacterium]